MDKIVLKSINKIYGNKDCEQHVLRNINLTIEDGDMISIMGPSGCGKSTLLNIIGLLDKHTTGTYTIGDVDISKCNDTEMAKLRNKTFGFIFQNFNLIKELTALENIKLSLTFSNMYAIGKEKYTNKEIINKSKEMLALVGLDAHVNKLPSQLSGGQQQRVAIARALVNDPDIILADEPTGALDIKNGKEIVEILERLNDLGKPLVIVTHDKNVANCCKKNMSMLDGILIETM